MMKREYLLLRKYGKRKKQIFAPDSAEKFEIKH